MVHAERRPLPDFQSVTDGVPGLVLFLDATFTIRAANRRTAEWTSLSPDELIGERIDVLFPPSTSHDIHAYYGAVLREQRSVSFEHYHGEKARWLEHYVTPSPQGLQVVAIDITQRKQESQQLSTFKTLLSSMSDFAYLFDLDGRFTYVNRALLDLWGIDLAEAVGKNFAELGYPTELVELHREQIERVIATRQPLRADNAYTDKEGQTGYYEYIFTPVLDDGRVVAVAGVTRDVTEQRRAEQQNVELLFELTTERARLQAILDQMPSGLTLAEAPSGRLTLHNRAAAQLLGHAMFASESYEGYSRYGAIHDDGMPYRPQEYPLARALLRGEIVSEEEMRYRRGDGTEAFLSVNSAPIRGDDGTVVAAVSIFHDISDRKRMEEALRASEERFSKAFYNGPVPIVIADEDGRYVDANDNFVRLVGYEREALVGRTSIELGMTAVGDRTRQMETLRETGRLYGAENRIRTRGGEIRDLLSSTETIEIHGKRHYLTVHYDVTDRKRAEAALRESEERLTDVLESITDAFYVLDWNWRFLYVNRTAEVLWGKHREDLIGKTIWDELPQLVGSESYERALQAARDRQPIEFETRSPVLGRWIDINLYPGKQGLVVYFRDVTARREMEDRLRRSEEHYRLLFESNPHAMWVYDTETLAFVDVNSAAVADFGYSREEFLRMTIFDIRPKEERERLRASVRRAGRPAFERFGTWQLCKKDGTIVETDIRNHLVTMEGRTARLVVVQDVTERNRIARENHRRRRELETLLDLSQRLTRRLDLGGLCQTVVDATVGALQHADTAILWLHDEQHVLRVCVQSGRSIDPSAELAVSVDEGLLGQVLRDKELRVVNLSTAPSLLRLSEHVDLEGIRMAAAIPLLADHTVLGVLLVGSTTQDATFEQREQHLLQSIVAQAALAIQNAMLFEDLRQMSRRLLQAEEVQRRRIACELHDEVGAMLTSLQLSLRMNPAREAAARRELKESEAIVARLLEQVRHLSLTLRPSLLDDLGLVAALLWLFERYETATRINVQFQKNFTPETRFPPEIETAVFRIVQEALTNVARHAETDTVQVLLFKEPGALVFHVIDEGRGFEPGERIESTGLNGMQERAALLEGTLEIESTPGEGTRISGRLPLSFKDTPTP